MSGGGKSSGIETVIFSQVPGTKESMPSFKIPADAFENTKTESPELSKVRNVI